MGEKRARVTALMERLKNEPNEAEARFLIREALLLPEGTPEFDAFLNYWIHCRKTLHGWKIGPS